MILFRCLFGRDGSLTRPRTTQRVVPTLITALALSAMLMGCGQQEPTVRRYTEVSVPPPVQQMPNDMAHASAPPIANQHSAIDNVALAWSTPDGWSETPGSGMRLATFNVGDAECTIISLPGDVGGLEANLMRWAGQIGAPASHEVMHPFMDGAASFETKAGDAGQFFDFQQLSTETEQSILAGIIKIGETTVFVKMTGAPATLNAEREQFLSLCKSVEER